MKVSLSNTNFCIVENTSKYVVQVLFCIWDDRKFLFMGRPVFLYPENIWTFVTFSEHHKTKSNRCGSFIAQRSFLKRSLASSCRKQKLICDFWFWFFLQYFQSASLATPNNEFMNEWMNKAALCHPKIKRLFLKHNLT